MYKNTILTTVAIIAIGLFIYVVYYNNKVNTLLHYYDNKIESLENENAIIKNTNSDFKTYFKSEDVKLNESILLTNENGLISKLKDIIMEDYTLVIRYSTYNCESCVQFQINSLKPFINKLKSNNIIVISDENQRSIKLFKEKSGFIYQTYFMHGNLIEYVDNRNEPYFFIIDKSLHTRLLFIPHKESPELTNIYLKTIVDRFFSH
jgi:hypothetical protein